MAINYVNETGNEQELLPTEAATINRAEASEGVATAAPAVSPATPMPSSKPPQSAKFDPARLRVSQNFGELAATRKVLTSVPVTKPNKQQWVRVHPDAGYRENLALIEEKESRTMYVVEPGLVSELAEEVIYVTLHTAMTREGTVFLPRSWRIRINYARWKIPGTPNR